jgi:hypothetical protein
MQVSQLVPYSIGIAAENKPLNTRTLNVTPIEVLSALDGELNFNPTSTTSVGTDSAGNRYEVKATVDNTITAEWYPGNSNRVTPPDIRRGELIDIFRLADSDQYYWRCMGLRDDLRRLETVIFAFNGSPKEGGKGIDFDTCYFLEISTHKKLVTFQTSQANGEPFRYTFQINADEGRTVLTDDVGNYFELDSAKTNLRLENIDGTHLELNRKDIKGYAPNNIDLKADNNISLTAGKDINLQAGNNAMINGGKMAGLVSGGTSLILTPAGGTLKAADFSATQ